MLSTILEIVSLFGLVITALYFFLGLPARMKKEEKWTKFIIITLVCLSLCVGMYIGYRQTTNYYEITKNSTKLIEDGKIWMEDDTNKVFVLRPIEDPIYANYEKVYINIWNIKNIKNIIN